VGADGGGGVEDGDFASAQVVVVSAFDAWRAVVVIWTIHGHGCVEDFCSGPDDESFPELSPDLSIAICCATSVFSRSDDDDDGGGDGDVTPASDPLPEGGGPRADAAVSRGRSVRHV
jgi:hypothetical protein